MRTSTITITILFISIIVSINMRLQEAFLWEATLLHILTSWILTRRIKNKLLKSAIFIMLMSTIPLSINVTKLLATSITEQTHTFATAFAEEIKTFSLESIGEIFRKSARAISELAYRLYKSEWKEFDPSKILRRASWGIAILLSLLPLLRERVKIAQKEKT